MASVSPTRIMSTPAASATRADGKSYAVTITSGDPLPLRAAISGALIGARASGGDDAVVISVPPPSGAPTAPGSTASVASRCDGARLRELRLPRRGAGAGPADLRDTRDVGHARVASGARGSRAVVRLVPVAVPPRGRRGRRGGVKPVRFAAQPAWRRPSRYRRSRWFQRQSRQTSTT